MRSVQQICEEAFAYHSKGNLDAAFNIYDQLLGQMDVPDPNVLYGYGSALVEKQQFGLAIFILRAALGLADKHAGIWTNLGVAYKHVGRDELALQCYETAHKLKPDASEPLASLAGYWIGKNSAEKVIEYANKSLTLLPDNPPAHMHLAMGLLEQGKFEDAWPSFEYRWETLENIKNKRPYSAPKWKGERVKTLAIHGEQGLGDEIMFMSLFSKAAERADKVVIECAERLIPTFTKAFGVPCYKDHAGLIASEGEPDAYIPMGSLPGILGLPDGKPYLPRGPRFVTSKPRIGIAWKGGVHRTGMKDRTLEIAALKPIFEAIDAEFVSVQYGTDEVDAEAYENGLSIGSRDFDSLQKRIAGCDLVITVCQTALHQAGAMGVPCWVLTPKNAPWVCAVDPMPWYDSVEIIRQDEPGKWEPVIARVVNSLKAQYGRAAA